MNLAGRSGKRMTFQIDDSEISERLQSLRKSVGAEKATFRPNRFQIVDVVIPAEKVGALLSPSGLLVRDSRPVFAYIRDHTEKTLLEWKDLGGPEKMKKLHFSVCRTLIEMKKQRRFERYRVTNVTSDKYSVDVKEGVQEVRLYPCQNCLDKIGYQCFSFDMTKPKRMAIVRSFNSQEAMDLLWQWFDLFRQEVTNLQSAHSPTGYTDNWYLVAQAFKRRAGWKCAACGVLLDRNRRQLDLHHLNGDKRNNSDDNLRCLCKACHQKEHPHYQVLFEDLRTIQKRRNSRFS